MSSVVSPFEILADYERLASRHAAAQGQARVTPGLWRGIAYRVGGCGLVSAIEEVAELLPPLALTPVPGTLPWLLGIANMRGHLLPVVDLRRFLLGERSSGAERSRLMVIRQEGGSVALLVDEVLGQRTIDETQWQQAEAETDPRLSRFVSARVVLGGRRLAVFSMGQLARAADFRQAAA